MINIKQRLRQYLTEGVKPEIWYHGTPDVTALEKEGGFTHREIDVEYINDIQGFNELQDEIQKRYSLGDEKGYHELLDKVDSFKEHYRFRKPIFLTNDYTVAKSYADPHRAFNYQDAKEKVLQVEVNVGRNVKIAAHGDRFRFIDLDKVRNGFIAAGIQPEKFDEVVSKINFYLKDKTKMKTDMIATIAEWFKIDTVDVVGVLDSYNGGSVQSTVRMVFDSKNVRIVK